MSAQLNNPKQWCPVTILVLWTSYFTLVAELYISVNYKCKPFPEMQICICNDLYSMHRSFHQSYFELAWAMPSKLHHLGCESLCFFLSDRRKLVGVDVSLWNTSERQNGGFFRGNQHFSKTGKREHFRRNISDSSLGTFSNGFQSVIIYLPT